MKSDRLREWLTDSGCYLRQVADSEGDILLAAPPVSPEDEKGATGTGVQEERVPESDRESTQLDLLAGEEPGTVVAYLPWGGRPPRQDADTVGIPESMTCEIPSVPGQRADLLSQLQKDSATCLKCTLGETRINHVFGTGNPDAAVFFIGEAPGHDEDVQGEPFVGRAGQLLNKIIESIGFDRDDVYIGNILKCRPPGNRDPLPEEVSACEPYLHRQMALIRPAVVCALGRVAAQTLLRTSAPLGKLRSEVHTYQGRPLIVTYHPAALLRNPHWKRPTWEDVQLLREVHDREVGG